LNSLKTRTLLGIPKWIFYTIFLLFFITSDYILDNVNFYTTIILFIVLALCYFLFSFPFRKLFKKKASFAERFSPFINFPFLIAVLFSICAIASYVANRNYGHFYGYLGIMMYVVIGYLFSACFSFNEFCSAYRHFFPFLCLLSLLVFLSSRIAGIVPKSFIFYENYSVRYSFFFFDSFLQHYISKNQAVFWEPGIFASFILIGLIIELFFNKEKTNWFYVLIEVIALITTKSLAGYLLFLPLIVCWVAQKNNSRWVQVLCITIFLAFFSSILFFNELQSFFFKFFPALYEKGSSLTTRLLSLPIDFEVWKTSPLFGVGTEHFYQIVPELAAGKYSGVFDASVSTTGYYIAVFGLVGFVLFFAYLAGILSMRGQKIAVRIGLLLISFIIINKETHIDDTIFWSLFFYLADRSINDALFHWNAKHGGFGIDSLRAFRFNSFDEDNSAFTGESIHATTIKTK